MTPKEKADELYVGFWHLTNDSRIAKQCALIAVNEILKSNPHSPSEPLVMMPHFLAGKYWQEVKQEIEKL